MFLLLAADLPYLFSIAVAADKVREDDDDREIVITTKAKLHHAGLIGMHQFLA